MPENIPEVESDLLECFYQSKLRTKGFVTTLARVVWEYNFVNKMFIEHYKKLSNLTSKDPMQHIPPNREVLIFGGYYPLSAGQISAIAKIVEQYP